MAIIREQIPIHKKWLWIKSNIPFTIENNYNDKVEKAPGTWRINTWELLPEQYHKNNPVFMLYISYDNEPEGVVNPFCTYSLTDIELSAIDSGDDSFKPSDLNETNNLIDNVKDSVDIVKDSVDSINTSVESVYENIGVTNTYIDNVYNECIDINTEVNDIKDNLVKGFLYNYFDLIFISSSDLCVSNIGYNDTFFGMISKYIRNKYVNSNKGIFKLKMLWITGKYVDSNFEYTIRIYFHNDLLDIKTVKKDLQAQTELSNQYDLNLSYTECDITNLNIIFGGYGTDYDEVIIYYNNGLKINWVSNIDNIRYELNNLKMRIE